jgi:hypothetical protein
MMDTCNRTSFGPETSNTQGPASARERTRHPAPALALALALAACGGNKPPESVIGQTTDKATVPETPAAASFKVTDGNAMLEREWAARGITPAPKCDDATFLRRASIDIVGTIPSPEDVTLFLNDKSTDKRVRAVERMLSSPRYADHWTSYWDDVLMGREVRGSQIDRAAFREFLHAAFAKNLPWDALQESSSPPPAKTAKVESAKAAAYHLQCLRKKCSP